MESFKFFIFISFINPLREIIYSKYTQNSPVIYKIAQNVKTWTRYLRLDNTTQPKYGLHVNPRVKLLAFDNNKI